MRYLAIFLLVGSAFGQHSNSLSWSAPVVTAPVVLSGYNVYKASTPGAYTKGTPLAKVTGLSYVDLAVQAGQTAYYVVTALCATCTVTESVFSAEVKATTPADSQPPAISTPSFVVVSR